MDDLNVERYEQLLKLIFWWLLFLIVNLGFDGFTLLTNSIKSTYLIFPIYPNNFTFHTTQLKLLNGQIKLSSPQTHRHIPIQLTHFRLQDDLMRNKISLSISILVSDILSLIEAVIVRWIWYFGDCAMCGLGVLWFLWFWMLYVHFIIFS